MLVNPNKLFIQNDQLGQLYHLEDQYLEGIRRINLFVGQNNSGKSRFLRELCQQKFFAFQIDHTDNEKILEEFSYYNIAGDKIRSNYGNAIADGINLPDLKIDIKHISLPIGIELQRQKFLQDQLKQLIADLRKIPYSEAGARLDNYEMVMKRLGNVITSLESANVSTGVSKTKSMNIYIPVLRGLRKITGKEGGDVYGIKTEEDYFKGDFKPHVYSGLTFYEDVTRLLLGNLRERELIADFQKFLSLNLFKNEDVALIPKQSDSTLHIKIGNEKERPIHELGDGIQHLIIMFFPLYMHRSRYLFVFIEEPEIYLHPGLQRKFIELLLSDEFRDCRFFMTTHSNHFLDISMDFNDMSIYLFKKSINGEGKELDATFQIENASCGDKNLLAELGVRDSSIFLANCVIWVEGITDRLYLRHYLKLYFQKKGLLDKYKEDIHYTFSEYAGNNITHWFLKDGENRKLVEGFCKKILVIADKDGDNKTKRNQKLREELVDHFIILPCWEIENLLTPDVILNVVRCYEDEDIQLNKITQEDYKEELLGLFIENKLLKNKSQSKRNRGKGTPESKPYSVDSGTVKDKIAWCNKALPFMDDFEKLSQDAQDLTTRIFNFINDHNMD